MSLTRAEKRNKLHTWEKEIAVISYKNMCEADTKDVQSTKSGSMAMETWFYFFKAKTRSVWVMATFEKQVCRFCFTLQISFL